MSDPDYRAACVNDMLPVIDGAIRGITPDNYVFDRSRELMNWIPGKEYTRLCNECRAIRDKN